MASIDHFPYHDSPDSRPEFDYEAVPHGWDKLCACEKRREHRRELSYVQIQNAAKSLCRICEAFEKAILAVVDGSLPGLFRGARDEAERATILEKLVFSPYAYPGGRSRFDGREHHMRLGVMDKWLDIELFRDAEEQSDFQVSGYGFLEQPRYGPTTDSDRGFRRAQQWLRQCLEHHSCKSSSTVRYPKRLIDVRNDQVRLFECNRIGIPQEPYVCLSHRWGGPENKRLISTVRSVHSHMQEIPWDNLPKTFQDAVIICRRMSVSYLWIDSLCILQEFDGMTDEEAQKTRTDFAQENSAMASIYRDSYFTISATMSTSMASGIFSKKPFNSHRIRVTDDSGKDAFFRIREHITHSTTPTDLETRGWALQENILPSRVLAFGPFDLTWRCKESHTCECGDTTTPRKTETTSYSQRQNLAIQARLPLERGERTHEWWALLIGLYTGRNLTNEQDKLPALSGLAQVYHEATNDTYLAGLWKASLPHSLCWFNTGGYRDSSTSAILNLGRRPRDFRAPSWSWASIDTQDGAKCGFWWSTVKVINLLRKLRSHETHAVCTIYGANCQPKAEDVFGEVRDGFIEIGTTLISATIHTEIAPSRGTCRDDLLTWTLSNVEDGTHVEFCLPDCAPEDDGLKDGDAVHCAPMIEHLSVSGSKRGCIVLKRLHGQTYRRVGFCVLQKKNPGLDEDEYWEKRWHALPPDATHPVWADNVPKYALEYNSDTEVLITVV